MSFKKSNAIGQVGEQAFCELLERAGLAFERNTSKSKDQLAEFDVRIYFPSGQPLLAEVKFDARSNTTGNLAIEVWNSRANKASGVSATKAHLWVFALSATAVYVIRTVELHLVLSHVEPLKVVERGGDNNARLYLYKKDVIIPLCRRIDMMSPTDLYTYLEHETRCQQHLLSGSLSPSPALTTPLVQESPLSTTATASPAPW